MKRILLTAFLFICTFGGISVGPMQKQLIPFDYDCPTDSCVVGTVVLDMAGLAQSIPAGWFCTEAAVEIVTPFASATSAATVQIGVAGDPDLFLASTPVTSLGAGAHKHAAVTAPGGAWKAGGADEDMILTIGTEALTAGALTLWVECVESAP